MSCIRVVLALAWSVSIGMVGCGQSSDSRIAGPNVVIREDVFKYPLCRFKRPKGSDDIQDAVLYAGKKDGPVVWLKDGAINVSTDTRQDILDRFEDAHEESLDRNQITFKSREVTLYLDGDRIVLARVWRQSGASISLGRDTPQVSLPCSTAQLIERFGPPLSIKPAN